VRRRITAGRVPAPGELCAATARSARPSAGPDRPGGSAPKARVISAGNTIGVQHVPASTCLSARGRIGSRGGLRRGVSSRTGMEPTLQRRRGVRRHRRAASRWPEHPAAPAGPPDGDRPAAPAALAAAAGHSLRRSSGGLTCARSSSARRKRPPSPGSGACVPGPGGTPGGRSLANGPGTAGGREVTR